MIWVYGGAFLHGGASKPEYVGSRLAARGVIVVSFNYRLGALGFLVSTADGLYGNYGLDDQKTAIQWVKENIQRFGGDPGRITLYGESAGAMSIGLHLLDQQSAQQRKRFYQRKRGGGRGDRDGQGGRGNEEEQQTDDGKLFHAVILQSNPLGYKYRSLAVANFIGQSYKEQLDCEDLRCLQSESPEELMHVQDTLMAVPRSIGDFFTWGPVVTDSSYYREVRLRPGPLSNVTVRQPIDALKDLRKLDVPVIIGSNSHEGTVFVFTAYPTRMTKIIYQALVFSFFRGAAVKVLRMYAPLARRVSESAYPDYRLVLSRVIGDYLFRCPNQYFASLLTGVGECVGVYVCARGGDKCVCGSRSMQLFLFWVDDWFQ
ncbi:Alpha/Beta hydrolase protein [Ochromonadaceae sp. CCMP2298]|nr:Alpha/Beta hydrolase protein [Ochromonadaceae sp. CCMP2298]